MVAIAMPSVIVDRWFERTKIAAFLEISAVIGLTALSAQVAFYLPFTPVPITMQTFVILLSSAAVGAQRAAIAQFFYLALALVGLPIMADGQGGLNAIYGATSGYLVGFIFASALVGYLAKVLPTTNLKNVFIGYAVGSVTIYFFGATGLMIYADLSPMSAISAGILPFILGDVLKALAASATLPIAWQITRKLEEKLKG